MPSASIKLSCSCGAQLIFSETFTQSHFSHTGYEREAFLKAHEVCRTKANDSRVVKEMLSGGSATPKP